MDAIKKKMQGMKIDKDAALERAATCEQQARDANLRAEKVRWLPLKEKKMRSYLCFIASLKKSSDRF